MKTIAMGLLNLGALKFLVLVVLAACSSIPKTPAQASQPAVVASAERNPMEEAYLADQARSASEAEELRKGREMCAEPGPKSSNVEGFCKALAEIKQ